MLILPEFSVIMMSVIGMYVTWGDMALFREALLLCKGAGHAPKLL